MCRGRKDCRTAAPGEHIDIRTQIAVGSPLDRHYCRYRRTSSVTQFRAFTRRAIEQDSSATRGNARSANLNAVICGV